MEADYQDRFGGLSRLVGKAGLERLRAAHVCVVGVGGVGSWTVEALARSGVGALTLIDLDDVCVTNVNRQLHALDGQIGRPKIEVLAERVRLINPACRVTATHAFSTEGTVKELLAPSFDCVVDAVDRMGNKVHLIGEAKRRGMGCVTVGSAGGRKDIARMRIGDLGQAFSDELLRQVRKKLRRDYGFEHGEDVIFGVRCVWSIEAPVYPQADGTCSTERAPGENLRIDCATGFGSGVWLTGAFGLAAAQEVVGLLLARKD